MSNISKLLNTYQTEVSIQLYRVLGSILKEFNLENSPYHTVGKAFCDKELHEAMRALLPQMKLLGFTRERFNHNKLLMEAFVGKMESVLNKHDQSPVEREFFTSGDKNPEVCQWIN